MIDVTTTVEHHFADAVFFGALGQRASFIFGLVVACGLLVVPTAHAQFDNGSAVGTIHDPTGAPIPNASVKITNTGTAITSQTVTNGNGDYEVPSLHVGVYTIAATAPGFSSAVAQNITISVGARQRIDLPQHRQPETGFV